jgi:sec-independent protein translocase protein TatC
MKRRDPEVAPDGTMPLADHLRELRSRLFKAVLAITVGSVVAWFYYPQIFDFIDAPFMSVVDEARANGQDVQLALTGVVDPFVLQLQVTVVAGILLSSPVWLYQVWRFVTPGLHRHERRWSMVVVLTATPLFLAGAALAYVFMPQALGFLLGFTPTNVSNIVDVSRYVSFFLNTVIVFGIGFLLPLFALLLNLAGVLPAKALISAWRWILLGTIVFAAVATPDGNPFTMLILAVPIMGLLAIVMAIAWLNDKRKRNANDTADLADDEISSIEDPTPVD